MTSNLMETPCLILRLARTNMTIISAVTHLSASIISTSASYPPSPDRHFSLSLFFRSWLFILMTQFMTHFFGEVYDYDTDKINHYARADEPTKKLTGGSKVLVEGNLTKEFTIRLSIFTLLSNILIILFVLPSSCRVLAFIILFLAYSYSCPPLSLNFHGLGELNASVITSILLPLFSIQSQLVPISSSASSNHNVLLYLLIIPPFITKFNLFVLLNLVDRRPDWVANKFTIPVILGPSKSIYLHLSLTFLTYLSAALIIFYFSFDFITFQFIKPYPVHLIACFFLSFPLKLAWSLSMQLINHFHDYELDHLLPAALIHSSLLVWSVLVYALFLSLPYRGILQPYTPLIVIFGYLSFRNFFLRRKKLGINPKSSSTDSLSTINGSNQLKNSTSTPLLLSNTTNCATNDIESQPQQVTHANNMNMKDINNQQQSSLSIDTNTTASNTTASNTTTSNTTTAMNSDHDMNMDSSTNNCQLSYDAIIVGGGIAGIISAITLHLQGHHPLILEKRSEDQCTTGADLALWPGAIKILKRLGVPHDFFDTHCYPLTHVHMCNLNYDSTSMHADILKVIDMQDVTSGTGEQFVLVSRNALINQLHELLPKDLVVYGASVKHIEEFHQLNHVVVSYCQNENESETFDLTARIVIGADGSHSITRQIVQPGTEGDLGVQYQHEVCYRGIIDLNSASFADEREQKQEQDEDGEKKAMRNKIIDLIDKQQKEGIMQINYGAGLRSSYGYMNKDRTLIYWWVKEKQLDEPYNLRQKKSPCDWPSPLYELHEVTEQDSFYGHTINDSKDSLCKWSSTHCVVIGDAAHLVTPNMGQGACMAIEDAFILCTLLNEYWKVSTHGHLEAFYQLEFHRKAYIQDITKEARKQLFLGQLSSSWGVWLREMLLRYIPVSILQNTLKKNNFNVDPFLTKFDSTTKLNT